MADKRYLVDTDMKDLSQTLNSLLTRLDSVQPISTVTNKPTQGIGISVVGITVANTAAVDELRSLYMELRDTLNLLITKLKTT